MPDDGVSHDETGLAAPPRTFKLHADTFGFLDGRAGCTLAIVASDTDKTVATRLRKGLRLPRELEEELVVATVGDDGSRTDIDIDIVVDAAHAHLRGGGAAEASMRVLVDTTTPPPTAPTIQPPQGQHAAAASARSAPADSALPSAHDGSDGAAGSKGKKLHKDWVAAMAKEWPKHIPRWAPRTPPPTS